MLFDPDEVEGVSSARALSLLKLVESAQDTDKDVGDNNDVLNSSRLSREEYGAIIKTAKRFCLLVDAVSIGASPYGRMDGADVQRELWYLRV